MSLRAALLFEGWIRTVPVRVSRPVVYQLAAESGRDPKTVERVIDGKGSAMSRAAVEGAAKRLGLTLDLPETEPKPAPLEQVSTAAPGERAAYLARRSGTSA